MQRAWCFDHGLLHHFGEDGEWCTAAWVLLTGDTDEEALKQKDLIWGSAQFFDQLPLDRQGGLVGMMMKRQGQTSKEVIEAS